MAERDTIAVEVVWADAGQVRSVPLCLAHGTVLADALAAAGSQVGQVFEPGQDTGIWGKLQPRSAKLADGDRVELYQPLKVDPKKARRERFAKQGARRAGLFAKRRPKSKAGYGA